MIGAGLLHDVCNNPDDDTPRLVHADWLEDQGESARAGFIRAQLRVGRLGEEGAEGRALEAESREVLARHEPLWAAPLFRLGVDLVAWRRGYAEAVELPAYRFLIVHEELFRQAPVREVTLSDAGLCGVNLAACPSLARLRALTLLVGPPAHLSSRDARALALAPGLRDIRELTVEGELPGPSTRILRERFGRRLRLIG